MHQRFFLFRRWAGLGLLGALAGCVEPYAPDVIDAPNSYLVVDGAINGNGPTTVLLSRTARLAATATPAVEKGAKLFIVDDAGARYALAEKASGTYKSDSLVLSPARKYQLRITTATNAVYASDLVPLKVTPPIDKLGWALDATQLRLLLSTHDAQQQSRYYRWGFVETWEFHSAYNSSLQYDYVLKQIAPRSVPIYTCWRTERSSAIRQGSSAQLSQDALTDFNVLNLSNRAERLQIRYSALVSQYAETAEEFAYYELLRKNTEAVGTVNDPLPVQLTGNVHRDGNAQEPVLGYVGAHTVQQKRIFIARAELPGGLGFDSPYQDCTTAEELLFDPLGDSILYPNTRIFGDSSLVPIALYFGPPPGGPDILGYTGSSRACVDCRTRGTSQKPSFW